METACHTIIILFSLIASTIPMTGMYLIAIILCLAAYILHLVLWVFVTVRPISFNISTIYSCIRPDHGNPPMNAFWVLVLVIVGVLWLLNNYCSLYVNVCYFIDADPSIEMVCSGCDRFLREENTAYYCPGRENLLFFRCDVILEVDLSWIVNGESIVLFFNPAQNRHQTIRKYSVFTPVIVFDGPVSNITSFFWFDTSDIIGSVDVTCESTQLENKPTISINPLGQYIIIHVLYLLYICIWE